MIVGVWASGSDRSAHLYCSSGGSLVRLGLIRWLSEIDAYTD
jgi:hypothetical protein